MEESLNTLKYANRARNIRNRPTVNQNRDQTLLAHMQDEIAALQQQLAAQASPSAAQTTAPPSPFSSVAPDVLGGTANSRMMQVRASQLTVALV
jgi:hypothetical protein